jgi:hypothetical protein
VRGCASPETWAGQKQISPLRCAPVEMTEPWDVSKQQIPCGDDKKKGKGRGLHYFLEIDAAASCLWTEPVGTSSPTVR